MKPLIAFLFVFQALIARENPFDETNAYKEEAARIIEVNETVKIIEPLEEVSNKEQTDEVKDIIPLVNHTKKLLPFLEIEYNDETIKIISKYKLKKQITLPKVNKLIFDFSAKEDFFTVREELKSSNFLNIAIGDHKEKNFFRVAIEVPLIPKFYKVTKEDKFLLITKQ